MYKLAAFRNKLGARERAEVTARIVVIDIRLRDLRRSLCTVPPSSWRGREYLKQIDALKTERAELQKKLPHLILS